MSEERMTIEQLNDKGCINVLCSMLHKMSREYKKAYAKHILNPGDEKISGEYTEIRDEFLSDYFRDLTHLKGNSILKHLDIMVQQDIEQYA